MTKKILDFLRMLIISPEFLAVLFCTAVRIYWPRIYSHFGQWLNEGEKWNYLLGLMGCWMGASVFTARGILFPSSDFNNKILLNWSNYPKLRNRVYYAICICFLSAIAFLGLWIFKDSLTPELLGLIFAMSFLVAATSLATMVFASFAIREILETNT